MNNWLPPLECRQYGSCTDIPFEEVDRLFFGHGRFGADEAMAICARCPVLTECMAWTLKTDRQSTENASIYGVFGGMSPTWRKAAKHMAGDGAGCVRCGHRLRPPMVPRKLMLGTRPAAWANQRMCHRCWKGDADA